MENRRRFLATTTAALAAGALLRGQNSNVIKVGLVGCGGRGTGAASQALHADDFAELTAVADVFQDRIDQCLAQLNKTLSARVKVDPERQFVGLDAYQKLIDSGVDVVLLATPPGFRPTHLRACVEAGKHIFCEKPIAVDAPGVRHVLESVKISKQKNLSLVAGFCWRYANHVVATFEQIHNGAIGDLIAYYATYYTSPVRPIPPASTRPAGMGDLEWELKNWYNFLWICGDSIVEQAVHSADKIAWAMKDQPPVSCVAVGGRQIPSEGGNIFDHFEVNYLYPNNFRGVLGCRQIDNCWNENADYILGSKGSATIGRGPFPTVGENWRFTEKKNDMYQYEHDVLFASIRKGQPVNDGERMASSTLLAMMGRMAAYTGQEIGWDQALNSQEKLFPDQLDWNTPMPVAPMARPGQTKFI